MKKHHFLAAAAAICFTAGFGSAALARDAADLPPNAVAGKCYQRVLLPEVVETYQERVVDTPERTEIRVIPAVFADRTERVVIREGRTEYIDVAPTYRTVTETVVVRPASYRVETIPARYETISERVLVREAYTMWKRGVPPHQRPTAYGSTRMLPTGEVLCLIEVPAEYALVTRQVMREPAREVRIEIPAETQVVTRQVVDRPGRVETRVTPPEYGVVRNRVEVSPARTETYTVPATYKTVTRSAVTKGPRSEWREIGCEPPPPLPPPPPKYDHPPKVGYIGPPPCEEIDVSAVMVRDVQSALSIRRYYNGARNGVFSVQTSKALKRFQAENNLRAHGIDAQTLRALGVPYTAESCRVPGERG